VTIIVVIIASGVVSLTLTPMMCSRVLKSHKPGDMTPLEKLAHHIEEGFLSIYGPMLTYALKHWYYSVLAYLVCGFGVYWFATHVPKTFLPVGDSGLISGVWLTDTDTSPTQIHKFQDKIIDVVRQNPHVLGVVTATGLSQRTNSNQGIMFVALDDARVRPPILAVTNQLKAEMAKIPGVIPAIRPRPALNISVGAVGNTQGGYAYLLSGLDKDKVYASAFAMITAMRQSGLFSLVNSDFFPDNRQLEINVNRNQASNYGVPATNLAQTISKAYSQNYSYLIKSDYLQYWVIVEASPQYRARQGNLNEIYFNSLLNQNPLYDSASTAAFDLNNSLVPFHTVAGSNVTLGPLSVNHFNGFTSVTIFYDLMPNVGIGTGTDFVEQTANKLVPPEIMRGFQGDALVFRQTVVTMGIMFLVALFVMYVILGILYESYIHPLTVLSSLPVALVGGLGTLWLAGSELSLYGWIGMFMLAGLVKKNGIMMIDFAIMRQAEGRSPAEAVHEACLERFRPIIMTTLAAFFGALPLAMGLGADAASRLPLGLSICGGLMFSQLITLFVTPVTYLGMEWTQVRVLDRIPFFARRHALAHNPVAINTPAGTPQGGTV
jgi:HAE1 family hydrophobic/amphiphilic exporter-1